MDFKNITLYPELIVDIIIYIAVGAALLILCKWIHDWKEERRLHREYALHLQMNEDESV